MQLALQLMKNRYDAEDLYQEVFLKAYKKLHQFQFKSEFFTWLYRITVNTAYNYKRKASRMYFQEPGEDNGYDPLTSLPADENRASERMEILNAVKDSLGELPQQQRTVFILKHLQKQKIKDIAKILDVTEGTVKKYLFRAMEKLRVQLKEYRYV